jgi:hypothetical protein
LGKVLENHLLKSEANSALTYGLITSVKGAEILYNTDIRLQSAENMKIVIEARRVLHLLSLSYDVRTQQI